MCGEEEGEAMIQDERNPHRQVADRVLYSVRRVKYRIQASGGDTTASCVKPGVSICLARPSIMMRAGIVEQRRDVK